jgi:hypothetical protein
MDTNKHVWAPPDTYSLGKWFASGKKEADSTTFVLPAMSTFADLLSSVLSLQLMLGTNNPLNGKKINDICQNC